MLNPKCQTTTVQKPGYYYIASSGLFVERFLMTCPHYELRTRPVCGGKTKKPYCKLLAVWLNTECTRCQE